MSVKPSSVIPGRYAIVHSGSAYKISRPSEDRPKWWYCWMVIASPSEKERQVGGIYLVHISSITLVLGDNAFEAWELEHESKQA